MKVTIGFRYSFIVMKSEKALTGRITPILSINRNFKLTLVFLWRYRYHKELITIIASIKKILIIV
jgi:hypothetical protein